MSAFKFFQGGLGLLPLRRRPRRRFPWRSTFEIPVGGGCGADKRQLLRPLIGPVPSNQHPACYERDDVLEPDVQGSGSAFKLVDESVERAVAHPARRGDSVAAAVVLLSDVTLASQLRYGGDDSRQ